MGECKKCIHKPVCFKQGMRDKLTPTGFELECRYFKNKSDVVEVVRCKDCKHFDAYEGEEHKGDCGELVGLESCVYEDDFCSYGERKERK